MYLVHGEVLPGRNGRSIQNGGSDKNQRWQKGIYNVLKKVIEKGLGGAKIS